MNKICLLTVLSVALATVAIFTQGCASNHAQNRMLWYRPGTSADQTRRDLAFCQNEALLNERSTSIEADTLGHAIILGALASSSENSRQNQIVQNCMIEKGYTLLDLRLLEKIKAKADSGDAESQCVVGQCYYQGKGVEKDGVEAVKWLRKAADQNYATGQFNLGMCYEYGVGVQKDHEQAFKWYSLAAAQGDEYAKARLLQFNNLDFQAKSQPETDIITKLTGHWTLMPSPEIPIRGKWDIYFLPNSRYKSVTNFIDKNGQPLPTKEEDGRYYITGNSLVTWADKDDKPGTDANLSVTDTQLQFRVQEWLLAFQKQTQ